METFIYGQLDRQHNIAMCVHAHTGSNDKTDSEPKRQQQNLKYRHIHTQKLKGPGDKSVW